MINTARYKNYGQMNEQANGETIADEDVWQGGTLVTVSEVEAQNGPIITSAPEKVFAI